MTDKKVIQKAVAKVGRYKVDDGFHQFIFGNINTGVVCTKGFNERSLDWGFEMLMEHYNIVIDVEDKWFSITNYNSIKGLLFSHAFAKAFWGEKTEYIELAGRLCDDVPIWQYELQKMVLEKNPIDYLRKFVETGFVKGETKLVGGRFFREDGGYEDKLI